MKNLYCDANRIYDAAGDAIRTSKFKGSSKMVILHKLQTVRAIQEQFFEGNGHVYVKGKRFPLQERGKKRYITSSVSDDKIVNHLMCDGVLTPSFGPYVIYDNSSSQVGKGVHFHRRRFEEKLRQCFREYGTNHFAVGLMDYSGFYANIIHDQLIKETFPLIAKNEDLSEIEKEITYSLIRALLQFFAPDVSRFSDPEIEKMYSVKVDPFLNEGVDESLMTGEKFLYKGCDIGAQPSQNFGIIFPRRVDTLATCKLGLKFGAYCDDRYTMNRTPEEAWKALNELTEMSESLGLIVNKRKTRVVDAAKPFRYMQIQYWVTETGKVVRKIHPKAVTRERRRLKAYKKKLDEKILTLFDIEEAYKGWLGSNWKVMSKQQILNLNRLYLDLFRRRPKWKKGNSRLNWLMAQS